jgi:hypothetical protein
MEHEDASYILYMHTPVGYADTTVWKPVTNPGQPPFDWLAISLIGQSSVAQRVQNYCSKRVVLFHAREHNSGLSCIDFPECTQPGSSFQPVLKF